jgi:hypothetical protein
VMSKMGSSYEPYWLFEKQFNSSLSCANSDCKSKPIYFARGDQ